MIRKLIRVIEYKLRSQLCKLIKKHKFIIVREPSDIFQGIHKDPIFFEEDGLRYCRYCRRLESFDYHCLGLNPPQYIVDNHTEIAYARLIGDLVSDPYNLLPEDLQLIKIIKPELYDYCKIYVNKGE